ncbi:MAG: DNA-binding transcriptional LysR family regulator [Alteromonadaceae bacterium]|jgi:DNA-binding transcriptional LysR family regulator
MSISIKRLQLFEATARLGKLTLAANEFALSQSAASQALKELEETLGYPLFNRIGRDLVITENGLQALPKVRQIAELLDSLQNNHTDSISGTLRIVASETIATYLLPTLLADFIKKHPEVRPDIHIGNTQMVINCLDKGKASIGLIEGPALHKTLHIEAWKKDQLQVFCHPLHDLAAKKTISLEQITQQQWIIREPGSGTRAIFDAAIERTETQVLLAIELSRQSAIKASVKAGLGLGCLSELAIAEEIKLGSLVKLSSPLDLTRRLSIVTRMDTQHNSLNSAFISHLQK